MITDSGMGAALVAPPTGVVAIAKLLGSSFFVGVVTDGEDFAGNSVEKFCGSFGAREIRAVRDIACAYENRIASGRK